jgi:hypothetical protein
LDAGQVKEILGSADIRLNLTKAPAFSHRGLPGRILWELAEHIIRALASHPRESQEFLRTAI